jgi:hypothetical protein
MIKRVILGLMICFSFGFGGALVNELEKISIKKDGNTLDTVDDYAKKLSIGEAVIQTSFESINNHIANNIGSLNKSSTVIAKSVKDLSDDAYSILWKNLYEADTKKMNYILDGIFGSNDDLMAIKESIKINAFDVKKYNNVKVKIDSSSNLLGKSFSVIGFASSMYGTYKDLKDWDKNSNTINGLKLTNNAYGIISSVAGISSAFGLKVASTAWVKSLTAGSLGNVNLVLALYQLEAGLLQAWRDKAINDNVKYTISNLKYIESNYQHDIRKVIDYVFDNKGNISSLDEILKETTVYSDNKDIIDEYKKDLSDKGLLFTNFNKNDSSELNIYEHLLLAYFAISHAYTNEIIKIGNKLVELGSANVGFNWETYGNLFIAVGTLGGSWETFKQVSDTGNKIISKSSDFIDTAKGYFAGYFLSKFNKTMVEYGEIISQSEKLYQLSTEHITNIPTPTPSTLSIKTPQSITINDKSITASNGDEITLSFDDNFYFKDGIDGAKDLDNPYKIIYKSGYDYKTLSATYDDELNGLKFVVDTDQAFEIIKVEYLSSDGEYISIGLPSTWENVVLENSTQTSVNLTDGLVAHYEFEDNANDSSGNGNDGTEYGGVSYTDGVIGKAGSFDGVDDYIFIPESDSLNVKKITMSYYIQTKDIDIKNFEEEWQIVNKERMYESAIKQYGEVSYAFDTENDTKYPYWIWYGTDYIMENDNFHHIAITYDGNYVKSYIDGHIISTKSIQGNGNIEYHKSNVSIGVRNIDGYYSDGIPFNWFQGQIDDLRIYNRALNESEIKALYELGTTNNTQEEESTNDESNTEVPTQTVEEITNYTITPPTIDNIANYYTDLPNGIKYQSDIYFATLKGIVHGYPSTTDNTKREFRPADNISLAETLKMILLSANDIGLIQLPKEEYFYKSYPIWAMPYYTFARNSGAIDTNKNDLSVIYPTREQIARLLVMALDLENRLQDFVDIDTIDLFDDEDSFGDEINLRYAKIAKAYGLFMTNTQARPTDTATRGEVASIISRLYMMPTANIDISKTTIEFGEEFDINFINKKAQKISNDTLVDSSDEVTSRFAINQREQNSTTIDSSNLNIGTNHITAIVSNNGVNNFLSKPITIDYSDKDSDGVQDHLDIWSNDSRYALDTNNNGIPNAIKLSF